MQIHQPSVTGSLEVTGSIVVTGSTTISGSLYNPSITENNLSSLTNVKVDTASGAFFFSTGSSIGPILSSDVTGPFGLDSILSASYAVSSSHEIIKEISSSHADQADTASFVTGSNVHGPLGSNSILSSSFALTASHFEGSIESASHADQADTASFVTGSNVYGPFGSNSIISASYAVTSSHALETVSASYAVTSSHALEAISASYVVTSSHALEAVSSSYAVTSSHALEAISSSYAVTSSHALEAISASYVETASFITGSNVYGPFGSNSIMSASYALTASYLSGSSDSASYSLTSSYALTASHFEGSIESSSYASQADTASFVTGSNVYGPFGSNSILSSSFALTASHFEGSIESASYALTASYAVSASHAVSASYAPSDTDWYEGPTYLTSSKDVYITGSTIISSSLTVSGSTFLTGSFVSTGSNIFAHTFAQQIAGAGTWSTQTGLPTVDSSCVSAAGSYTTGIMAGGCTFNATPSTSQPSCTCVNTFNGVTWTSITNLNCGRFVHGTTGDSSAALVFGGRYNNCFSGTYCTTLSTEEWNGLAWNYGGNMNQCRNAFGSVGTATDAFAIAGYGNGFLTNPLPTENYNASTNTWSACPPITTGRSMTTATGNSNSATLFAGYSTNTVETWNGVSWGMGTNYPAATYGLTGVGKANNALIMGGQPSASPTQKRVYSYDGSAFTAEANSPYQHYQEASFGDQSCAVIAEAGTIGVYSSPITYVVNPTLHSHPDTNCLDIFVPTTISGSLTNSTIESTNNPSYNNVVVDASGTFYKGDSVYDLDRLTTASVSSNTITFTKGDSSTFDITVDTGSGGGGGGSDSDWYDGGTFITSSRDVRITGSLDTNGDINFETLQVVLPLISQSGHYVDDTAAASGGVPLGGLYRNGNFIAIRLT